MIPYDKSLHALVGGAIFSAAYVLFTLAGLPALHIAAGAVVLADLSNTNFANTLQVRATVTYFV